MKASIGLTTQAELFTAGTAGATGLWSSHSRWESSFFAVFGTACIWSMAAASEATVSSGRTPPIGILGVRSPRTYCISSECFEFPGSNAGPCLPPFNTEPDRPC